MSSRPPLQTQLSATAALVPSGSSTKRLSTHNQPDTSAITGAGVSGNAGNSLGLAGAGAGAGTGAIGGAGSAAMSVGASASVSAIAAKDVVSPGELCGFVDTLLAQLESRFDDMSEQVLSRMSEMSGRIDNLETTIQDLMSGDIDAPASGSPSPSPAKQR